MPRIDPSQLLQTLKVLLAPDGGIKSPGEVPRFVQLMQKFSKKLVSKCIYIHILTASEPDLLELFLTQKGWDLLNAWFADAYASENYYLCGDLITLFTVCPMTSARLKENVEINQAPKLIRQLSADENISADVRTAALQVLQRWMSVIRAPPVNGNGVKSENKSSKAGKKRPISSKYSDENFVSGQDTESDNEAQLDFDDSKDYNPSEDMDGSGARKKMKREDSTDVDDLLGSTETSEEDEDDDDEDALTKFYKKREAQKQKEEERRKERERKAIEEKKSKSFSKTEMRDKLQSSDKDKIKEIAKKLKEESTKAAPSIISHLGRIPKIKKPDSEKKSASNVSSFGDLLGGLDTVKPKPKAAPIKNKNKDLLETFTEMSPIKPKSRSDKSSSSGEKERSDKDKERSKDKDRHRDKDRHKSKDKHRDKDRDKDRDREKNRDKERSKDKESKRERRDSKSSSKSDKSESDRPKPKLDTAIKRKSNDLPSPKEEKKSPKVIKESNFFGDLLGDIMKEPPKKKKRRPSDVKISENNLKELSEKAKELSEKAKVSEEKSAEKEPSPSLEYEKINSPEEVSKDEVENSNDLEFSEPTSDLPREVRGILVFAKGNKAKRKITWKEDRDLVSVEYFELDETERSNVYKEKSFEEMKKREAMFEKSKYNDGYKEEEDKSWKFVQLVFKGEAKETVDRVYSCYGRDSKEKKAQEDRELTVLKALQFGTTIKDPAEPDAGSCDKTGILAREIPLEDLSDNKEESSYSYNDLGWPAANSAQYSQSAQDPAAIPSNIHSLINNISTSLLSSILPAASGPPPSKPDLSKPPPGVPATSMTSEEADLLAAQKAAAAALGLAPPPSQFGPGPGHDHDGFRGRGGSRGHYNNDRGHYNNRGGYNNQYRDRPHGGRDNGYDRGYNKRGGGYHNQYNRDRQYGGRETV